MLEITQSALIVCLENMALYGSYRALSIFHSVRDRHGNGDESLSDWNWPTVRGSKQAEIPSLPKKMAVADSSPVPKQNHLEPVNIPDIGERWSATGVEERKKEGEQGEGGGEAKTERLSNGISEHVARDSTAQGEEVMDTTPSEGPVENGDRFVDSRTDVDMEKEEEEVEEEEVEEKIKLKALGHNG